MLPCYDSIMSRQSFNPCPSPAGGRPAGAEANPHVAPADACAVGSPHWRLRGQFEIWPKSRFSRLSKSATIQRKPPAAASHATC